VTRLSTEQLRKAGTLSASDWLLIVRAQLALFVAQVLVWTRPQGRLVESRAPGAARMDDVATVSKAKRLGLAVDRAGSYGVFRATCLVRSVALQRLLDSNGIHGSRIRIGVRLKKGQFDAHAWVEYGTLVLGDHEANTRSFSELTDVHVLPPT
jgi:hypothetical protein